MTAGTAYTEALNAGRVVRIKKGHKIVDVHPDMTEVVVKTIARSEPAMDKLKDKLISLGTFSISQKTK